MKSLALKAIKYDVAKRLVAAALSHAEDNDWIVAVAVGDSQGNLVAFGKHDLVAPPIVNFALDKAFTAGTLRRATADFGERMSGTPALAAGVSTRQRLLTWGGGVPIFEDGVCIGGIAVSGVKDFEDIECARVALQTEGLSDQA